MAEERERHCSVCGRSNPVSQPRCIHCGQRQAQGSGGGVLLTTEEAPSVATTPWWQASSSSGGQIPLPPQVRDEVKRVEEEKQLSAEREAQAARRREETAQRLIEMRERLAAKQAEVAAAEARLSAVCGRCGVPNEAGFSFCLRCGEVSPSPPKGSGKSTASAQTATGQTTQRSGAVQVAVVAERAATRGAVTPGLAALLSFFVPGIGQFTNGQFAKGMLLLLATYAAISVFGFPLMGIAMLVGRVLAAVDAYRIAERRRRGSDVRDGEWDLG